MIRFFAWFVGLLVALFLLELTPPVQAYFVMPWTNMLASISTFLVTLFDPSVVASGNVMRDTVSGFAVAIEAGCNGVEAAIVLVAAMLAFPAPWRYRALGIAIGIAAVQILNIVRVISLFYIGQWDFAVFEWAHQYVWQALIMLDVLVVWLIWVRRVPAAPDAAPPSPPPALAPG
jgi:exosortase H (IPTLxxWG-CTERM-specific)